MVTKKAVIGTVAMLAFAASSVAFANSAAVKTAEKGAALLESGSAALKGASGSGALKVKPRQNKAANDGARGTKVVPINSTKITSGVTGAQKLNQTPTVAAGAATTQSNSEIRRIVIEKMSGGEGTDAMRAIELAEKAGQKIGISTLLGPGAVNCVALKDGFDAESRKNMLTTTDFAAKTVLAANNATKETAVSGLESGLRKALRTEQNVSCSIAQLAKPVSEGGPCEVFNGALSNAAQAACAKAN